MRSDPITVERLTAAGFKRRANGRHYLWVERGRWENHDVIVVNFDAAGDPEIWLDADEMTDDNHLSYWMTPNTWAGFVALLAALNVPLTTPE